MAEIEFRDGVQEVPDHLAEMMRGLPTHQMTLTEATQAANNSLVSDRFNRARQSMVTEHFKNWRNE